MRNSSKSYMASEPTTTQPCECCVRKTRVIRSLEKERDEYAERLRLSVTAEASMHLKITMIREAVK